MIFCLLSSMDYQDNCFEISNYNYGFSHFLFQYFLGFFFSTHSEILSLSVAHLELLLRNWLFCHNEIFLFSFSNIPYSEAYLTNNNISTLAFLLFSLSVSLHLMWLYYNSHFWFLFIIDIFWLSNLIYFWHSYIYVQTILLFVFYFLTPPFFFY